MKNQPDNKAHPDSAADVASKSQRRREALEVKSLARRLIALDPPSLERLPLESGLRDAIDNCRRIRSNVARKRQLQYVAKLLRRGDPDDVVQALEAIEGAARQRDARHHRAEAWREHLLQSGDAALGELLRGRDDVDRQIIRQLVRTARQEARNGRPPAAARRLFRLLRDLDEASPLPATNSS